jgi:cell division protein ZapA
MICWPSWKNEMSTVTLSIGPKSYTIACADGQEAHIKALGAMIAEKYAQLGSARAPLEAQNLVFAALFMADELAEAKKRLAAVPEPAPALAPDTGEIDALRETIARLETELAAARIAAAPPAVPPPPSPQPDLFGGAAPAAAANTALADQLEALAARAEAAAAALEAAAANA